MVTAASGGAEAHDGRLIVFEGIDGAGTTTQVELLARALRHERRVVHVTREPSFGPVGALLRLVLSGRLSLGGAAQAQIMALLFAADRLDHVAAEIAPHLRDGAVVLSDRYDLSSLTYQCATAGAAEAGQAFVDWVRELNRYALRPDATVVLDVSPETADARRRGRTGARELYEVPELQRKLAELYRRAELLVPGDRVIHVGGEPGTEQVAAEIRRSLAPILGSPSQASS
ncbi:MAG: dTMP kinase [Deltaproteobacteria bacterium]|nr:dTMP kinase [Deltaproteobacteria bacterium]